MKSTSLFLAAAALVLSSTIAIADEALLAIPGKLILDAKLDAAPAAPFRTAKGQWEPAEGALRGSELASDKHGAVMRTTHTLADCIVEVEVKFDGAKTTTLSMNAVKDHMARIILAPTSVTVQRDDNDHEGPDKAIVFHRVKANLADGQWHKVRMEMVGDTMLGKVDDVIGYGSSELFTKPKANPGLTVSGQSVLFRNFKVWEATKNPKWDEVKAGIKNEVMSAPANPKGKGKGKGQAKKADK